MTPRPADSVKSTSVQGTRYLLSLERDRFYVLEGIGNEIWEALDGQTTLSQIAASISDSYGVPRVEVENDLRTFVEQLLNLGLLVGEPPGDGHGLEE